ncbi:MAG TPA: hypothetical protein ENH82_04315 [bacterium]|nr:hypothetical protein [bacterium]
MSDLTEVLARSRVLDSSLERVRVSDLNFSVEGSDIFMAYGDNRARMTMRALRNLAKLTTASPKLLINQQDIVLRSLVQRQLAGIEVLQVLKFNGEITSLFPAENSYSTLPDLVEGIDPESIISIRGDVVESDHVSFLIRSGEYQGYIVGSIFTLCPNGMDKNKFSNGLFRTACTNSAIDNTFFNEKLNSVSPLIMRGVMSAFAERADEYLTYFQRFHQFMRETVLDSRRHGFMLEHSGVPSSILGKYKNILDNPGDNQEELQGASVRELITVEDSFNLITHLAKDIESVSARNKTESAVVSWVDSLRRI